MDKCGIYTITYEPNKLPTLYKNGKKVNCEWCYFGQGLTDEQFKIYKETIKKFHKMHDNG